MGNRTVGFTFTVRPLPSLRLPFLDWHPSRNTSPRWSLFGRLTVDRAFPYELHPAVISCSLAKVCPYSFVDGRRRFVPMTRIDQFQLRFDAEQDRLLLRVNTSDRKEFRLWLTRRMVARLWPVLRAALESDELVQSQPDRVARDTVLSFQQDKALAQADFQSAFREKAEELPFGEAPVLVSKVQLSPTPQGGRLLRLAPTRGPSVQIGLNPFMLHSFCGLLVQAVAQTDWGLGLKLVQAPVDAPSGPIN